MTSRRSWKRVATGVGLAAVVLAAGLGALLAFTPRAKFPTPIPGRPLLEQGNIFDDRDEVFTDAQLSVRFNPPANWSMQARSTESPTTHRPERTVVKYKRLIPGLQVAWLKLSVADTPGDESPAELLKKRRPPEADWRVTKPVEDGLTVGGRPAARITFGGPLDADDKGEKDYTCEVVAVRHGKQAFYFAGTYQTADPKGQKRIRTAMDTVAFDK